MAGTPTKDRITQLRVRGFRSLADVTLDLSGLTVLIGDNGSGKSSIVEACEVLRYLANPGSSLPQLFTEHPSPIRTGTSSFSVHARIEGDGPRLDYAFTVERTDRMMRVLEETLDVSPIGNAKQPRHAIRRQPDKSLVFDQGQGGLIPVNVDPTQMLLTSYGTLPRPEGKQALELKAMERAVRALQVIDVHLPFEVLPAWAAKRLGRRSASRESSIVHHAERLEPLAANLANVFNRLKNEFGSAHWRETMDYVCLGLGNDVDEVNLTPDASGGQHALAIRYKSLGASVPAAGLSDGTLAYLAFVALLRLPSNRSLLAFDEPELHMHPALLTRVVGMLETIGRTCPVIVTTHSDRVLDALTAPGKSAVLCELDEQRATRLLRPDEPMLAKWLQDFRGLGELRAAGLQPAVMERKEPSQ